MRVLVAPCRRLPSALSLLDYEVPIEMESAITEGILVEIPLGKTRVAGLIFKKDSSTLLQAPQRLKKILSILSPFPALSSEQVSFLNDVSLLYRATLGALVTANLFPLQKKSLAEFGNSLPMPINIAHSSKNFCEKATYYTSASERLAFFKQFLHDYATSQSLILFPTIEEAERMYKKLQTTSENTRLFTSETSPSKHRNLWFEVWQDKPLCIIGTRRALNLPWRTFSAILLDAEADHGYQSFDAAPRGHVRDLAFLLAKHHAATLWHSGHSPSISGFKLLQNNSSSPSLIFQESPQPFHVDVAKERQAGLSGLISLELEQKLHETPNLSFLFLNQRGSAQCIMCKDCRHTYRCPVCTTAMLTYHARGNRLSCHSCGHEQKLGACPVCGGFTVKRFGYGTSTLEEFVRAQYPDRPCIRLDKDQSEHDLPISLPRTIIIGTDFAWPKVPWEKLSLMSFIDIESALHVPEWHISEETWYRIRDAQFRLPSQAELVVQSTREYEKSLVPLLSKPLIWYERELEQRKLLGYPPYATILKIYLEHPVSSAAEEETQRVFRVLTELTKNDSCYTIHHPAPLRPFFVHGLYRYGIIIKIRETHLTSSLKKILIELPPAWKVAINPAHLLS